MKRQLSILTTTLLLATSGYASSNGEACDRNHYQHKSHNHQSHHSGKHHKFGQHATNTNQAITLESFLASKKERFYQMDTNGDGVLTQNEMRSHRKNHHHKPMRGGKF